MPSKKKSPFKKTKVTPSSLLKKSPSFSNLQQNVSTSLSVSTKKKKKGPQAFGFRKFVSI